MELGLAERAAIVTAASKGLGRGSALALATAGCNLVVNARDAGALKLTADACREHGVDVIERAGDATDPATPAALVEQALHALCRLDIAIVHAGRAPPRQGLQGG